MTAIDDILVRRETGADRGGIAELTRSAFAGHPYSDGSEPEIIDRLRSVSGLELSLVAVRGDCIVGHVAFSPASSSDGSAGWFALGPISVEPALRRRGIGSTLIVAGFKCLRERGARGCILVGNPAYYSRFGFRVESEHCSPRQPAQYFMVAPFDNHQPQGGFEFHPAFYGGTGPGDAQVA